VTPVKFSFADQERAGIRPWLLSLGEPSLFEPFRCGLIKAIEKAKAADIEPATKFLANSPKGVFVIFVGEGLPNSQSFKKAVADHHIAFQPLKGAELGRWTEKEFASNGILSPPDEVVEKVILIGAENPDSIAQIVEKYASFLDGETPSSTSLRDLYPMQYAASDFALAESLVSQPRAKTEVLLHQLFQQGSSPYMLLGLLTRTWSSLLSIRALSDKGVSGPDIRNELGIAPWLFNKYLPLAKKFPASHLADHIRALMEADFRLKDKSLGPAKVLGTLARKIRQEKGG
jgi:DNA polymerase III delta subunit